MDLKINKFTCIEYIFGDKLCKEQCNLCIKYDNDNETKKINTTTKNSKSRKSSS
jgi:hypothetical protein